MWKGEDGMDALSLLKTRRCLKDKVRPALLVLTITDEQAALAAPESNQLLHLQLRNRYYAQVLNFMRMVEGAMCVFISSFPFSPCFHPHPHCFPTDGRIADAFPLLIILAYFL